MQGREQSGRRRVLVVSDDAINARPLVVAVVVGTDAANVQRREIDEILAAEDVVAG